MVSVDEHGEGKGSGRSVQGFNLHECIASCADILLRFGGHAMAAGLSVREEDLQTLRQRLNDWAARECPVLRTPPLECDLSVHLDRLTVESVRRLDQLAPYGADNPSPVFVLERAVVDGVYAVSEGKHCRLRLRQGSSSIYAVWFGMHPEQVPYRRATSWTQPSAFRSTIRPGAHSCRAASSSCTRRASATQLQSRPRWCRRCAGVRP